MKKSSILSTGLVGALLLTGVTPSFASPTESVTEKSTPKIELVNNLIKDNQSIESLKNSAKYSTVDISEKEVLNIASVVINGVEADIDLGDSKEVTEEMLLNLTQHIRNEQNGPTANRSGDIGTFVEQNPSGGTTIGTKKNSFSNSSAKAVSATLKGAVTGIATAVGYYYTAAGASVVAAISTSAGDYINVKPRYTTSKTVKHWSDYFDTYLFDHYIYVYTDSSRTKLAKVIVRYDTISRAHAIGYN